MPPIDFVPPRCPNSRCRQHLHPEPTFFLRRGSYRPKCRRWAVPRYCCRTCRCAFSYQTFRADYRDHRPDDNSRLFLLLTSGVGLRQAGRLLDMSPSAVQRKFRKLGRTLRRLNRNLLHALPADRTLLLDEIETFETSSILPITVPVVVDQQSRLVVATRAGSIRRVAVRGSRRRRRLERHERKHGRRADRSRRCVQLALRRCRQLLSDRTATLLTDRKALYGRVSGRLLGSRVKHVAVSSQLPRTSWNPLFAVNHTEAMLRDNCGRLRRRTWLVSKTVRCLRWQLDLFAAYRNWQRPRCNHDEPHCTPGVVLGLVDRSFTAEELLAWRQDWARRSTHPGSADAKHDHESYARRTVA